MQNLCGVKKAIVLSSGGVDSTTLVGAAVHDLGAKNVSTLSIYYGQRHEKELECAKQVAWFYGVHHYELDLSKVFKYSDCALMQTSTSSVDKGTYAEQLKDKEVVNTYVPFRNGLFLAAAASFALSVYPDYKKDEVALVLGAHADDAAGDAYPDCSEGFVYMMKAAIGLGTGMRLIVIAPFIDKTKSDIVRTGLAINAPYHLTWSCYEGKDKACGKCGTCIDRLAAFKANNVEDPIEYEEESK